MVLPFKKFIKKIEGKYHEVFASIKKDELRDKDEYTKSFGTIKKNDHDPKLNEEEIVPPKNDAFKKLLKDRNRILEIPNEISHVDNRYNSYRVKHIKDAIEKKTPLMIASWHDPDNQPSVITKTINKFNTHFQKYTSVDKQHILNHTEETGPTISYHSQYHPLPYKQHSQEYDPKDTDRVSYNQVNKKLYDEKKLSDDQTMHTEGMKSAIKTHSLPHDTVVYSGIKKNLTDIPHEDGHKKLIMPAFTSTSLSRSVAHQFSTSPHGDHILELHLPKHTNAAWADKISQHCERELILHPGTKIHVHPEPTKIDSTHYWHGKVVHDGIKSVDDSE